MKRVTKKEKKEKKVRKEKESKIMVLKKRQARL